MMRPWADEAVYFARSPKKQFRVLGVLEIEERDYAVVVVDDEPEPRLCPVMRAAS